MSPVGAPLGTRLHKSVNSTRLCPLGTRVASRPARRARSRVQGGPTSRRPTRRRDATRMAPRAAPGTTAPTRPGFTPTWAPVPAPACRRPFAPRCWSKAGLDPTAPPGVDGGYVAARAIHPPIAAMQSHRDRMRESPGPHAEAARDACRLLNEPRERMWPTATPVAQHARPAPYAGDGEARANHLPAHTRVTLGACGPHPHTGRHAVPEAAAGGDPPGGQPQPGRAAGRHANTANRDPTGPAGEPAVCIRGLATAAGLAKAMRERLFHPFTSTRGDGTGLGLSCGSARGGGQAKAGGSQPTAGTADPCPVLRGAAVGRGPDPCRRTRSLRSQPRPDHNPVDIILIATNDRSTLGNSRFQVCS